MWWRRRNKCSKQVLWAAATSEKDVTWAAPAGLRRNGNTQSKKTVRPIQFVVDEEQTRLQQQTIVLAVV